MQMIKQKLDFNGVFSAFKTELVEVVTQEVLLRIRNAFSMKQTVERAIDKSEKLQEEIQRTTQLHRVRTPASIPCPNKCGWPSFKGYKQLGYHARNCPLRKDGQSFYKRALAQLNHECNCGKKAIVLLTSEVWPDGVKTKNQKAAVILNLIDEKGIKEVRNKYFVMCRACSFSYARSHRERAA